MLRLTTSSRRTIHLSYKQTYRIRFCSSQNEHSHKIYALPFKLPEEKVGQIVNMAYYVNQHAFFALFKILKSVNKLKLIFSETCVLKNNEMLGVYAKNTSNTRYCSIHECEKSLYSSLVL